MLRVMSMLRGNVWMIQWIWNIYRVKLTLYFHLDEYEMFTGDITLSLHVLRWFDVFRWFWLNYIVWAAIPSSHFLTGYNSSRSCTGCLNVLAILLIIILLFYSQPVIARTACLPMFLSAVSPLLSFCVLLHERTLRSPPKLYRNFLLHMWMTLCCLTLREYLGIYYLAHSISHVKVYYRF